MLFGFHLRPLEECPMGQAVPAMYYSASATVMVDFHGKAAHAARPHLGINALDAASHAVQAVNGIHLAPSLTWSAKATRFLCDAGVTNSVPAKAHVCWDLRCEENDGMATLKERVVRAIESSAAAYGASVDIRVVKEMPAAIIDAEATAIISQAICETFGEAGLTAAKSTPGSEDFFPLFASAPGGERWLLGTGLQPAAGPASSGNAFRSHRAGGWRAGIQILRSPAVGLKLSCQPPGSGLRLTRATVGHFVGSPGKRKRYRGSVPDVG